MKIKLGGPVTIVHIDESLFRHTPKVNTDDTYLTHSKIYLQFFTSTVSQRQKDNSSDMGFWHGRLQL